MGLEEGHIEYEERGETCRINIYHNAIDKFSPYGHPYDFWRFELEDMKNIFSDCKILVLDKDFAAPGVFIKVKKPNKFVEKDLSHYELYSVVGNKRMNKISDEDFRNLYHRRILKRMMHFISKMGKLVFSKA